MNIELKNLEATEDWETARAVILKEHRKDRESVGLSSATDLTALQLAAYYEPDFARTMLAHGVELDLHSACALGDVAAVRQSGTTTGLATTADLFPPMCFALLRQQMECVELLLQMGDDPNRSLRRIGFFVWEIEAAAREAWKPIHIPATHGYLEQASELIEILVRHGADLNARSPLGLGPLSMASIYGWIPVMNKLLELGCDVNERSFPISDEVWRLSSPAGVERSSGHTPLMIAATEGGLETAKLLISKDADLSLKDSCGSTALHIAANPWWHENVELVRLLVESGCDPHDKDDRGRAPFDVAKDAGLEQTCKVLRQA